MNIMEIILLPLAIVVMLSLPFISVIRGYKTGTKAKNAIILNLCSFFAVIALAIVLPFGSMVSAETAGAAAQAVDSASRGLGFLSAALATGASAAIGAVSEEPKSFVKSLIFVALGEGVAIYGVLISILILNKL